MIAQKVIEKWTCAHQDHNDQFAVFLALKTLSLALALTLACLKSKISNPNFINPNLPNPNSAYESN